MSSSENPSPVDSALVSLVVKNGGTLGAVGLMIGGVGELGIAAGAVSPQLHAAALGLVLIGAGLATFSVSRKQSRTTDMIATTQAENKIQSPFLAPESKDPVVQKVIDSQIAGNGTANGVLTAAKQLKDALSDFNPENLTADRILQTAKAIFPDRIGTGVWVNLLKGSVDRGATFEVWRNDKLTADALLGHATAGVALGYQFAQAGDLCASIFAGAAHPYSGTLTVGWSPVLGATVKF